MTDPSLKHTPERKYEITPLELFFDLVFAFALSQLSQHLLTHRS
jgi:low temperature requirement protein LtrA